MRLIALYRTFYENAWKGSNAGDRMPALIACMRSFLLSISWQQIKLGVVAQSSNLSVQRQRLQKFKVIISYRAV